MCALMRQAATGCVADVPNKSDALVTVMIKMYVNSSETGVHVVSQSVDLGQNNNPNTTPTKDYENVRVVVYLRGVQRGCAEEGERGSTPTG